MVTYTANTSNLVVIAIALLQLAAFFQGLLVGGYTTYPHTKIPFHWGRKWLAMSKKKNKKKILF